MLDQLNCIDFFARSFDSMGNLFSSHWSDRNFHCKSKYADVSLRWVEKTRLEFNTILLNQISNSDRFNFVIRKFQSPFPFGILMEKFLELFILNDWLPWMSSFSFSLIIKVFLWVTCLKFLIYWESIDQVLWKNKTKICHAEFHFVCFSLIVLSMIECFWLKKKVQHHCFCSWHSAENVEQLNQLVNLTEKRKKIEVMLVHSIWKLFS